MGDSNDESAQATPAPAAAVTSERAPAPQPAGAVLQSTPSSTTDNENTAAASGTAPIQPRFLQQQEIPCSTQQQMPYHTQHQMPYVAQQQTPYHAQQQIPYIAQQQMTYHGQQPMLYHSQQMPYQAQHGSPYQHAPRFHPYQCSQNAASSSGASTSVSYGWPSPQPSTSKMPTPTQQRKTTRKVGRPRKYPLPESQEDEPEPLPAAQGSGPSAVDIPARDEHDVSVGPNKAAKCAHCALWAGRYILEPCFHYGFCISCLEVNANIDKAHLKAPACPACDTTITKYVPGIRVTIMDLNYADN